MVKCMNSRMDKYYKEKEKTETSRTNRHKGIYKDISDENYEKLNLTSNVSVIATDDELDIGRIKEIVDSKYRKRENVRPDIEDFDDEYDSEDEESTKEYDLKKVIETAHKNKTPNYDRERFEHIRETQYDILNSLNIINENEEKKEAALTEEEATLINLIKTVNENAEKNHSHKEQDTSDDLLSDLMGGDDTEVLQPMNFDEKEEPDKKPTILEELEKTKQLSKQEIAEELEKEAVDEENDEDTESDSRTISKTEELSNSFYTGNYTIDEKDLDDFVDLEKEMKGGSLVVKILIVIIALITVAVAVYLLNKFLNLGLF